MTTTQDQDLHPSEKFENQYQEGDFIYCSWGYNQTNNDFAKIVEVSDTGKTVKAQRVSSRRLEGGDKTSKKVMPKDEAFGEEFRLYVKEAGDKPCFKGTYPNVIKDGETEMERKGIFFKWDKTSTRETRPGMGH